MTTIYGNSHGTQLTRIAMAIFVAGYVTYVSLHVKDEKTVSISNQPCS